MAQRLKNFSFRHKIFILCLLISLIPVAVLGTFCYAQIKELLIERERTALTESLIQECNALNNKTDTYLNSMNHILWNNNIIQAMSANYSNNYEMYIAYRDIIDPLFTTIRALNSDVNSITIYTDKDMNPHGTTLKPLSLVEDAPWFMEAAKEDAPFFHVSMEDHRFRLIGRLNTYSTDISYVVIDIDYGKAFTSLESLYEHSYGILLTDRRGKVIYEYDAFEDDEAHYRLTRKELLSMISNQQSEKNTDVYGGHSYVIETSQELTGQWNLYLYRPTAAVSAPANEISAMVLTIIFFCIIAVIFIASLLSRLIVRPLELLTQNMKQVEQGTFEITAAYDSNDEIGRLFKGFKHMVQELHHLIDEVLKSKISQQKYEMRALQAQINPHFLYNSLSLINSKALMADQEEISEMTQLLSTFYRTTLNKGKNIITVENELNNIRSYISIQFIMHSNSFDVSYRIDDRALPCTMINLLLQPLVENAIMHGIDHKESPGRGLLEISCQLEENILIFTVTDNGPGMDDQKLETILTTKSSGYGIQNVHHRIQLFYGDSYGLHYESTQGEGTRVTLTLPVQDENSFAAN